MRRIIALFITFIGVGGLAACGEMSSTPPSGRLTASDGVYLSANDGGPGEQIAVVRDNQNGREYLVTEGGGITPLLPPAEQAQANTSGTR